MAEWVAAVGGGEITRLERHVARREAWVVDVTRPDGSVLEGFLRLERDPIGRSTRRRRCSRRPRSSRRWARTSVPVPEVHGRNDDLRLTLFERVPVAATSTRSTTPRSSGR